MNSDRMTNGDRRNLEDVQRGIAAIGASEQLTDLLMAAFDAGSHGNQAVEELLRSMEQPL